jgi:hypothetical protein
MPLAHLCRRTEPGMDPRGQIAHPRATRCQGRPVRHFLQSFNPKIGTTRKHPLCPTGRGHRLKHVPHGRAFIQALTNPRKMGLKKDRSHGLHLILQRRPLHLLHAESTRALDQVRPALELPDRQDPARFGEDRTGDAHRALPVTFLQYELAVQGLPIAGGHSILI